MAPKSTPYCSYTNRFNTLVQGHSGFSSSDNHGNCRVPTQSILPHLLKPPVTPSLRHNSPLPLHPSLKLCAPKILVPAQYKLHNLSSPYSPGPFLISRSLNRFIRCILHRSNMINGLFIRGHLLPSHPAMETHFWFIKNIVYQNCFCNINV